VLVVPFDAAAVQGFFYDDLCCVKPPDTTLCPLNGGVPACCPGSQCSAENFVDAPPGMGRCVARCKTAGEKCMATGDCCQPTPGDPDGIPIVCGALNTCVICGQTGAGCTADNQCCSGKSCDQQTHLCVPTTCSPIDGSCMVNGDCCTDLHCETDHTCQPNIVP